MPPKPGTFQRRRTPPVQAPPKPVDPIERALRGPQFWGEVVTAAEWERLRAATWERRLHAERDWPPHVARHDGIVGEALRLQFNSPEGWDARPKIVALAETGLAEVEDRIPGVSPNRAPWRGLSVL